ncbi:hypothetical protein BH11GEM1_BH11GEM1_21120 [soil metagenome]
MASTARIDELKKKFDENPRRYFAPLANEFRKAGDIEQAILICEEFLPQQPGHMSGHIVYGQALYEAGRSPEARGVFETALGLDPENLIALRHLGDIARGQADPAAARGWYARVLDADPRNEEIQALIADIDREIPQGTAIDGASPVAPDVLDASQDLEIDTASLDESFAQHPAPQVTADDASIAVTSPFGMPAVPPPLPAKAAETDLLDGFSLHGFDSTPDHDAQPVTHVAAEGLESASFEPPQEHIPTTDELDDSLDSGVPSFAAPSTNVEALDGLQGSGGMDHLGEAHSAAADMEEFAPLELDDETTLPPQGDPLAYDLLPDASVPAREAPLVAPTELMEFETPAPQGAMEIPVELPPSVIAAEAGLIEARETAHEISDDASLPDEMPLLDEPVSSHAPFVTETMAELYVAQGLRDEARAVYEQLLATRPGDARLEALVASLMPTPVVPDAGPTARDFFARLAARRPASRTMDATLPADNDFAPMAAAEAAPAEHVSEPPPADAPYSVDEAEAGPDVVPTAIERSAAMRTPDGSISALFGNRTPGTSEDSAAAALAQAFGGQPATSPGIAGKPAHAASGELSLDSVFRDGPARPPRTSQSFSFDQFFTGGGERERATPRISGAVALQAAGPAERPVEEVEKFNSWLQGLKPQ